MHRAPLSAFAVTLVFLFLPVSERCEAATAYTPLVWRQEVRQHATARMVGQFKHATWVRDRDHNYIDDLISERFRPGEAVDVIIDLNRCLPDRQIREQFGRFGRVVYISQTITAFALNGVHYDNLPEIATMEEVAMIEWQTPIQLFNDISNRAIQARASNTYSPNTAQDLGFTGAGVNVAIIDSGVDDVTHEAFSGKFVGGFDAIAMVVTNPVDDVGHGTHVAGTALGKATAGRTCRTPTDGSTPDCGGVATGAGLVDIKVCSTSGCPIPAIMAGLDWLAANAGALGVRAANMSLGACANDDGTSALAQQVNYLAALGVAMVLSHGNASNCSVGAGTVLTPAPGSASFAITVQGSNDQGTVSRSDDTVFSQYLRGPRLDFNLFSPELLALKPDISAPGENIVSAQFLTTSGYVSKSGTSMAAPHVTGAAAVVIQAQPKIDPASLKDLFLRTADTSRNTFHSYPSVDPSWNTDLGEGLLNVFQALSALKKTDVGFASCVGPPSSPGAPCGLASLPSWDNTLDISTASLPKVGVANTITAQVRNFGAISATVLVNFGVYEFAVGNNQFHHIGTVSVTIPPMTTVAVNQAWTPAFANHQCVQANIQYGLDTNFDNNVTQRNLQVAPSVFEFRVENPFMVRADFQIRPSSKRKGWDCRVDPSAFSLQAFGECPRQVQVRFEAPPRAEPGERADCDIEVVATPQQGKPRVIGGVTVQTFVPRPCLVSGQVVDAAGNPVPKAVVTLMRGTGDHEQSGGSSVNAVTDADGVFAVRIPPFLTYRIVVEAAGVGRGEVEEILECGLDCHRFILTREGLRVSNVDCANSPGLRYK